MSRGLFIGRFQPFHKGHLYVIKRILQHEDEVIIGIGSAEDNFTFENPLTAGERYEIIKAVLINEGIWERSYVVTIPDINENFVWPSRVMEYAPRFDRVYTSNNLVEILFKEHHVDVVRVELINRELYQGSVIREKILKGEPWKEYIPDIVLKYLEKFNFEERIKFLYNTR